MLQKVRGALGDVLEEVGVLNLAVSLLVVVLDEVHGLAAAQQHTEHAAGVHELVRIHFTARVAVPVEECRTQNAHGRAAALLHHLVHRNLDALHNPRHRLIGSRLTVQELVRELHRRPLFTALLLLEGRPFVLRELVLLTHALAVVNTQLLWRQRIHQVHLLSVATHGARWSWPPPPWSAGEEGPRAGERRTQAPLRQPTPRDPSNKVRNDSQPGWG
mmetsp:Transcript_15124/g.45563  ORF Transcript_15124/g.45563 Transcript_15124/m.45563 type:complete len:217 (-) Transcript_15124:267-917(-)